MIKLNRPECPNERALATNYKHPDNKAALRDANFDKCMYCECKVSHSYHGAIEHIKPQGKFPELKFDWNNLGYVCAVCNVTKGSKYNEENPILDPYNENPIGHIVSLGAVLAHRKNSIRGELTLGSEGVDLNRDSLIERRQEKIENIERIIKLCDNLEDGELKTETLEDLKKEAEQDKEYSFCIKYLIEVNDIN